MVSVSVSVSTKKASIAHHYHRAGRERLRVLRGKYREKAVKIYQIRPSLAKLLFVFKVHIRKHTTRNFLPNLYGT
jgi:dTDP-4-dehydrorhamnose 3,5-epimerase-like enzyme